MPGSIWRHGRLAGGADQHSGRRPGCRACGCYSLKRCCSLEAQAQRAEVTLNWCVAKSESLRVAGWVEAVVAMSVLDAISQKDFLMIFISMKNIYCRKSVRDHDGGVVIFLSQGSYEVLPAANYQLENITTFFCNNFCLEEKEKGLFKNIPKITLFAKTMFSKVSKTSFWFKNNKKQLSKKRCKKRKKLDCYKRSFQKEVSIFGGLWQYIKGPSHRLSKNTQMILDC